MNIEKLKQRINFAAAVAVDSGRPDLANHLDECVNHISVMQDRLSAAESELIRSNEIRDFFKMNAEILNEKSVEYSKVIDQLRAQVDSFEAAKGQEPTVAMITKGCKFYYEYTEGGSFFVDHFVRDLYKEMSAALSIPQQTTQADSAQSVTEAVKAFENYVESKYGGADSDAYHDAPVDSVFIDGFNLGRQSVEISGGGASLKDNEIGQLINSLKEIAMTYGQTEQLRERIAGVVRPLFKPSPNKADVPSDDVIYHALDYIRCGIGCNYSDNDKREQLLEKYRDPIANYFKQVKPLPPLKDE